MKYRLIYLEDEESLTTLMTSYLKGKKDFELCIFPNPQRCHVWAKINQTQQCQCADACADFLITDNDMPHVTGLQFLQVMKHHNCKIKHVLMTSGHPEMERKVIELGYEFLRKPFSLFTIGLWLDSKKDLIDPQRKLMNFKQKEDVT